MTIIGVTGGSGSGKSLFCQQLGELCQAPVIDADQVYHALISTPSACTAALAEAFGDSIVNDDGSLNRPRLASLVFGGDKAAKVRLSTLNGIAHQFVRQSFEEQLEAYRKSEAETVILDVPLLFEAHFDELCHYTVSVLADYKARLARIMARDSLQQEAARCRIDAQPNDDFYRKRSHFTVYNNGEAGSMQKEAELIARQIGLLR